jgi:hypothetical protein
MLPIIKEKKKYIYDDKIYDSKEEIYFFWYLTELYNNGFIFQINYQPQTFTLADKQEYYWTQVLKTKTKQMLATILQGHDYTPDFLIIWSSRAQGILYNKSDDIFNFRKNVFVGKKYTYSQDVSFIEVKAEFGKYNSFRWFTINQKWVYQKFGIYIQMVKPISLFKKTFTPERFLFTDGGKQPRKLKYKPTLLEEFLRLAL